MTQHNRDFLDAWRDSLRQAGKSEQTQAAYQRALAHFLHWHEQAYEGLYLDLEKVMPRDIRDWKTQQQVRLNAAPASINQRLTAVKQFFDWALRQGLCRQNPCQNITPLRFKATRPQKMKVKKVRRLLRAAQDAPRDYAMLEVLLGTGIRVHELLALTLGDIVLGERSGKLVVRHGKGGQYREIPLSLDCRQALLVYIHAEHPAKEQPESALWFGKKGRLRNRSSVLRMLRKYGDLVGIENLHPHQLRHDFAQRYLAANPDDLRGLARLLGHRNLNTVMIYTEPDMDDLAQRLERMELMDEETE